MIIYIAILGCKSVVLIYILVWNNLDSVLFYCTHVIKTNNIIINISIWGCKILVGQGNLKSINLLVNIVPEKAEWLVEDSVPEKVVQIYVGRVPNINEI